MTLGDETLIIRGGLMARANLEANVADVIAFYGRPGLCVKVLIDDQVDLLDPKLVGNSRFCLSTPLLLAEAGLDPGSLYPTNDHGDRYQFTLWLPDEPADTLVNILWRAFRGPILKAEASSVWRTEDLRGLHHPRS